VLNVHQVSISGLKEAVKLVPGPTGIIPTTLLDKRGFSSDRITVDVSSGEDPDDFPAFSEQITVPAQPLLTRLGDHEPADLSKNLKIGIALTRAEPLVVEWEPAGSDFVEIIIKPNDGRSTDFKLRCVTYDDGCLEIPIEAVAQLSYDEAVNFRFRIEHHYYKLLEIREGNQLKAIVQTDVDSVLEGIVLP
jgi:hypothetical protein